MLAQTGEGQAIIPRSELLEQVVPAGLVTAIADRTGWRVAGWNKGALRGFGDGAKAAVAHEAVIGVPACPEHDSAAHIDQTGRVMTRHGRRGGSGLGHAAGC